MALLQRTERTIVPSPHEQDPSRIREIDGVEYIVDSKGNPRFYLDGSPVKSDAPQQCKAKSHTSGYRCIRYAVGTMSVCQKHGAGSPLQGRPGGSRPKLVKYPAGVLPPDLQERYERALNDPDILSFIHHISIIEGRIEKLLSDLPREEQVSLDMNRMLEGVATIRQGRMLGDPDIVAAGLNDVLNSVGTIAAERSMYKEVIELMGQVSSLKAKEVNHRKTMNTYVPAEVLWLVVEKLAGIVNEHVTDSETRNKIAMDLRRDLQQHLK